MANVDPTNPNQFLLNAAAAQAYLAESSGDVAANHRAMAAIDAALPPYLDEAREALDYLTFGMNSGDPTANQRGIEVVGAGLVAATTVGIARQLAVRLEMTRRLVAPTPEEAAFDVGVAAVLAAGLQHFGFGKSHQ